MIRYGLGVLVAAGACAAAGVVACGDEIKDNPNPSGSGGGASTGGGPGAGGGTPGGASNAGGSTTSARCVGDCCPTAAECYSSTTGNGSPGSECLATRDNSAGTGKRIQLRQQWIRAVTPVGNTIDLVYGVLSGRTQLPWPACNQTGALGSGGYIQIIDYNLEDADITKHWSQVGYAKYIPATDLQTTLTDGFCFGTEDYAGLPRADINNNFDYRLQPADMTPSTGYPDGLPPPMPLKDAAGASTPWKVIPAKATRLAADFDLKAPGKREELLAKLKPTGEYGAQGFNAVFFHDAATGKAHGYSPLSWTIVYSSDGTTHISIPIREVETNSTFNDASHNCVGEYRADKIAAPACAPGGSQTNPGWGCVDDSCPPGESPAKTEAYFLIAELEQIFAIDLGRTLCTSYPGADSAGLPNVAAEGFWDATNTRCKTASWVPTDTTNGIPKGDWCSATNSEATPTCHDAWRSRSFHVFAGAKIKEGTCPL